jgi:xylan 1,4-beta-xylosidase
MAHQSIDSYDGRILKTFEELTDQQFDTERLLVGGSRDTVDASVVRTERSVTVLLTNHALPRHAIKTEQVRIQLTDAPERCDACLERIDHTHANAERPWREAGTPEYLSGPEVERLLEASRMCLEPQRCEFVNGSLYLDQALPAQAVAAITVKFAPEQAGRSLPA